MKAFKGTEEMETTPLLPSAKNSETLNALVDGGAVNNGNGKGGDVEERDGGSYEDEEDDTPLPKVQLFLLCFARLVDPIVFFGVFPFINQMIQDVASLPEADVGFWSGVIESLFSVVQALVMIPWGWLSNHYGRKPGLIISMFGVSFSTMAFGLSSTLWQMILFRCIAGAFAGSIVTARTMISEISTKKTQAVAFGYFQFASNIGIFLGPLLGGLGANPAVQFPSLFGGIQLFVDYPYLLATFFLGFTSLVAAITCAIFLKETKPDTSIKSSAPADTSLWDIIKQPGVAMVLFLYSHINMLGLAYVAILPVFWFTSIPLGGVGFSPQTISLFMALGGLGQMAWMIGVFPVLQHRFGTGSVTRGCSYAWPFFFAVWPVCNLFRRLGWDTAFWVLAASNNFIGVGVSMAFTCAQLMINDISPSPSSLAMLNAIALTIITAIRAFVPGVMSSLFAIGVKHQILWGYLGWLVEILLALSMAFWLRWLPSKAEGKVVMKKAALNEECREQRIGLER